MAQLQVMIAIDIPTKLLTEGKWS